MSEGNGNTATATTATVDLGRRGAGRFAPSPTGRLHAGSLLAAVGSYLDARAAGAHWLVRIEDLDTARVIPGCADEMLRTLEAYGFEWDGDVIHQSRRREAYEAALADLESQGRSFPCSCTRKELADTAEEAQGYRGTCRNGPVKSGPTSIRFRVSDATVSFSDLFQGSQAADMRALGDFVIRRRDGIASYQLAVIVDDAWQGVTRVIRGADLMDSTPWQIELLDALALRRPIYGHLPLVTEPDGTKLSKSNRSIPLPMVHGTPAPSEAKALSGALFTTLTLLSQAPPPDLACAPIKDVWTWAFANWHPQALVGSRLVGLSVTCDSEAEIKT